MVVKSNVNNVFISSFVQSNRTKVTQSSRQWYKGLINMPDRARLSADTLDGKNIHVEKKNDSKTDEQYSAVL